MTVKLDGDIIMGDYITDKRFHSEGMGSIEDIRYSVLPLVALSGGTTSQTSASTARAWAA